MARFNPNTYDPSSDSSPGAPKTGNLVLVYKDEFACRCGCGDKPKNPKRKFVQGHDARLKGALIRAAATGTKVEVRQGKTTDVITAEAAAKVFGWSAIISKAKASYADKAKASEARAKATAARKAEASKKAAAKAKAATKKAPAKKAAKKAAPGKKGVSAPKAGTEVGTDAPVEATA